MTADDVRLFVDRHFATLRTIARSGVSGPISVIAHEISLACRCALTPDDAFAVLREYNRRLEGGTEDRPDATEIDH